MLKKVPILSEVFKFFIASRSIRKALRNKILFSGKEPAHSLGISC